MKKYLQSREKKLPFLIMKDSKKVAIFVTKI